MGFLVPIGMAIGSAIVGTVGAIGGAVGSVGAAAGGALGLGGGAASAAGAAASAGGFSALTGGLTAGEVAAGTAGALAAGTTAVSELTVVGGAAGGGSFASAIAPAALGAGAATASSTLGGGDTTQATGSAGKASVLGGLGKDLSYASDVGSLALLAKSLMLQPPPPQVAGAPSSGATALTSPSNNFSPATFAPQLQAGVNKSISAMAAASLGGTFTGAGQASGQRKTLLGQ